MDIKGLSSLVPELHLQQVGLFLFKKGIELYLLREDKVSNKFLQKMWNYNKMPLLLIDLWRIGALTGEVLLYIKPLEDGYKIIYYSANQFEPEYDDNFDLKSVIIRSTKFISKDKKQGEIVRINEDKIEVWRDRDLSYSPDEVIENPYGFLPCVIIQNNPVLGGRSTGEFERFEHLIEQHSWGVQQLNSNLEFFGGPIFYSSRSKSEMIEAGIIEDRSSISAEGGYRHPLPTRGQRVKARRVISGLEEGEQLGFTTPTPVDKSMVDSIDNFGKELRMALGGVPDLDLVANSGSLFDFQYRYSQVYITASRKAITYIDFGVVKCFEILMRMANFDGLINIVDEDNEIKWRYLGEVFPDTVNNVLTKSIVSRNLLRLGVSLESSLRHTFPDKTDDEIRELLRGGFAYELVDGVASIAQKLKEYDNINMEDFINSLINSEVANESRKFDGN